MCDGDLYPKGKKLRCSTTGQEVAYVGQAKMKTPEGDTPVAGVHIVLVAPLDFIDDGVREVREDQIEDEQSNVRVLHVQVG